MRPPPPQLRLWGGDRSVIYLYGKYQDTYPLRRYAVRPVLILHLTRVPIHRRQDKTKATACPRSPESSPPIPAPSSGPDISSSSLYSPFPRLPSLLPKYPYTPRAEKVLGLMSFLPKMDLLGAPLEALAFRYSAAVAGSLWAWFAVLVAALGLWRIRAALPPPPKPPGPLGPTGAEAVSAPVLIEPSPSYNADEIATPKACFMAYFHADDGSDEKELGDGVSDGDGEETEEEEEEEAPWGWERRIVRNGGDLRWYRYRDDAAFNGSVVRLWDGDVRLTVTAARVQRPT